MKSLKCRIAKTIGLSVALTLVVIWMTSGLHVDRNGYAVAAAASAAETLCQDHDVRADSCTRCHPELVAIFKQKGDWCGGHGVPESQCYLCNPELKPAASVKPSSPPAVTYCADHEVRADSCTRCHPELVAIFKQKGDWCGGHKVPESQCYLCNPELKPAAIKTEDSHDGHDHSAHEKSEESHEGHNHGAASVDWCAEHRVPESLCTKCNPKLVETFKSKSDWCGEHGVPESHCYLCNPNLKFPQEEQFKAAKHPKDKPKTSLYRPNSSHCATDEAIIQLASVQTAERGGLTIQVVEEIPSASIVTAPAEVEFDARESYAVTSLVAGTLVQWVAEPGQSVKQGDLLAYLESIDGANLRAEYTHAQAMMNVSKKAFVREQELANGGMNSRKDFDEAEAIFLRDEADFKKAAASLRALGLNERDLNSDDDQESLARLPIRARRAGVLVEQKVELGSILTAGESIGLISSLENLWIEAQIRERDLAAIAPGQSVTISIDGDAMQRTQGTVSWVSDAVDEHTRMGRVRIVAPAHQSGLRAHQFVTVQIAATAAENVVMIPADGVQWEGCCNVVFVSETRDRFRPKRIKILHDQYGKYAVTGIKPGDKIVTKGSYLLKTELMKSSLGAGCCGEGA